MNSIEYVQRYSQIAALIVQAMNRQDYNQVEELQTDAIKLEKLYIEKSGLEPGLTVNVGGEVYTIVSVLEEIILPGFIMVRAKNPESIFNITLGVLPVGDDTYGI